MKKSKLIKVLAFIFLFGHLLIIVFIFLYRFLGWFDSKTTKICLTTIAPLFVTHAVAIFKYLTENKEANLVNDTTYSSTFSFFAFLFPLAAMTLVLFLVNYQAFNPLLLDDFSDYLPISETVFGVFIGILIRSIFRLKEKEE